MNPYSPPKAEVADVDASADIDYVRLNRVASGQRLIISAFLLSIGAAILAAILPFAFIFTLVASVMGIVGVVRATGGLGTHAVMRVLYSLLMLVPLFNLLVVARLSAKSTKVLRAAGYKVGLLGAAQHPVPFYR